MAVENLHDKRQGYLDIRHALRLVGVAHNITIVVILRMAFAKLYFIIKRVCQYLYIYIIYIPVLQFYMLYYICIYCNITYMNTTVTIICISVTLFIYTYNSVILYCIVISYLYIL